MPTNNKSATTTAAVPNSTPIIRRATYTELATLARICSKAFWDDVLFGRLIHPYRNEFPADVDLYWLRRMRVDWWDWSHVFVVSTVSVSSSEASGEGSKDEGGGGGVSRDVITGQAHWSRMAPGRKENLRAGWELRWWDPRRLLHPLNSLIHHLLTTLLPSRAADPNSYNIIESSYPYLTDIWTGHRSESWYLESLAVDPKYQNQGHGRALVQWGMDQAAQEGISASVISAAGKEQFYQRCGFDSGVVGWSGMGEGNPLGKVPGGEIYFRDFRLKSD